MGFPSPLLKPFLKKFTRPAAKSWVHPIEAKLAVEGDGRLVGSISASTLLGFGCVAVMASITVPGWHCPECAVVPPDIAVAPEPDLPPVQILSPEATQRILKRYRKIEPKAGRPALTRKPAAEAGVLAPQVLTSNTESVGRSAYAILQRMTRDLPKLENVAVIKHHSENRFTGRPGRSSTAFNPEYDITDRDGNGDRDMLDQSLNDNPGFSRIATEAVPEMPRPRVSEQAITRSEEFAQRSTASILAVVKSHAPGLRHLYNQHLRRQPGLQGKVAVRFAIDARGTVVHASIEETTTADSIFEQAILSAVRSWRFEPVKQLGVEEVLVPLQFSE